jgi:hypothetical protein
VGRNMKPCKYSKTCPYFEDCYYPDNNDLTWRPWKHCEAYPLNPKKETKMPKPKNQDKYFVIDGESVITAERQPYEFTKEEAEKQINEMIDDGIEARDIFIIKGQVVQIKQILEIRITT